MTTWKDSSGVYEIIVFPSLSSKVIAVPADWLPTLTATTPCCESLKVCAIPDAPVPIKVPPVMTALVS